MRESKQEETIAIRLISFGKWVNLFFLVIQDLGDEVCQ